VQLAKRLRAQKYGLLDMEVQCMCIYILLTYILETAWNAEGRIQGQLDVELNENGREQAQRLGRYLATYKTNDHNKFSTTVYSSDLQRAHDTAKSIFSACSESYGFTEIVKDERLRELNFGELQGHTWTGRSHGSVTAKPEVPVHGGESYVQLQQRMEKAIEDMAWKERGKRVIVATHGGAVRAYLCSVLGLTMKNMSRITVSNTSITRIKLHSCDVVAEHSKSLKVLKREVHCMNWVPHDE
jgi:broad specificity phosphatase PhoE